MVQEPPRLRSSSHFVRVPYRGRPRVWSEAHDRAQSRLFFNEKCKAFVVVMLGV